MPVAASDVLMSTQASVLFYFSAESFKYVVFKPNGGSSGLP